MLKRGAEPKYKGAPLGPSAPLPEDVRKQVVTWLRQRITYWRHIKSLQRASELETALEELES